MSTDWTTMGHEADGMICSRCGAARTKAIHSVLVHRDMGLPFIAVGEEPTAADKAQMLALLTRLSSRRKS